MRAFPSFSSDTGENARETFGVLFRSETDSMSNRAVVYVHSVIEPDWSFLTATRDYLLGATSLTNPACKNTREAYNRLRKGQTLSFRLRANPTKRIGKVIKGDADLKGKRVGLIHEKDQIDWLVRKGEVREQDKAGGFQILVNKVVDRDGETKEVPRVSVHREGKQRGRKKGQGGSHKTTHLAVRFDGLLQIVDAEAFRETLIRGIGPGKAFGFGLLSVAPVGYPL
jgi:CRISPR system Cascade subunit CasE